MSIKKVSVLLLTASVLMTSFVGCDFPGTEVAQAPATEETVTETVEETGSSEFYDEEFLTEFATAVAKRQELGTKISNALTTTDVLEKELAMHPDYASKNFEDDVLKTYAVNYRKALSEQLELWKDSKKKEGEGYLESDFDDAIHAWLTQVDAVCALVEDYDLPIDDELAQQYKLEQTFWSAGLYKTSWRATNNTESLFKNMKKETTKGDNGAATVKLTLNNNTKYDLSGVHILIYYITDTSCVLENEEVVPVWNIDQEVERNLEYDNYTDGERVYDASSGLTLTIFPMYVKWLD